MQSLWPPLDKQRFDFPGFVPLFNSFRALKALWEYFGSRGVNTTLIWEKIKDIVIKTIIAYVSSGDLWPFTEHRTASVASPVMEGLC